VRGYDVDAVLCFREDYYRNWEYFRDFFADRGIPTGVVPRPPSRAEDPIADWKLMEEYYSRLSDADAVADDGSVGLLGSMPDVVRHLQDAHLRRLRELETMPKRALDRVWWPFIQHGLVRDESDVLVFDSAHGDLFSAYRLPAPNSQQQQQQDAKGKSILNKSSATAAATPFHPLFDGSASWWTQCLGHGHPELALTAAQAAGRYGHVLFPLATNAPALALMERLLDTVGKGWADRVFISDNGSTAMEVALKMALRYYTSRHGLPEAVSSRADIGVLGLKGSYHGDTIGAMDAAEGGHYNKSVEWYRGRGFWLDPPTVRYRNGKAVVQLDGEQWEETSSTVAAAARNKSSSSSFEYANVQAVYDVERRLESDPLVHLYWNHLERVLAEPSRSLGALVLEPVIMGAAGMVFVDPLFQRVLVDFVRQSSLFRRPEVISNKVDGQPPQTDGGGLAVVFDQVFTGLHRLGRLSASSFLGVEPDVASFAKILTGGLVPMSVTLASDAVFQSFMSSKKPDALLHGHSYTAHPIGCAVANKTLGIIEGLERNGAWDAAKDDWGKGGAVFSFWNRGFVDELSRRPEVESAMAMGTVLAIELRDDSDSGKFLASRGRDRSNRTVLLFMSYLFL
jgi:dethiobiotin synthetase/adenosylmethionine--8-amino-7-oxononanoate aminotransferase